MRLMNMSCQRFTEGIATAKPSAFIAKKDHGLKSKIKLITRTQSALMMMMMMMTWEKVSSTTNLKA